MDRIILIAQQLAKEGKVPNIALIKARLPKNIPLPAIIAGLKMWASNPNKQVNSPTEPALTASTKVDNITSFDALLESKINQAVAPLSAEIEALKAQLDALQQQLKTEEKN
jgi:hypothetical protein